HRRAPRNRQGAAEAVTPRLSRTSNLVFVGAPCTHDDYHGAMSKVIQIRGVPTEVHAALVEAADAQGLSLNGYVLRELKHLAKRSQIALDNAAVVRQTQEQVRGQSDRETILDVLHEGRGR